MITINYTLFAIISTLLNLLFQYLSFLVYVGFASLYVAIFIGTLPDLSANTSLIRSTFSTTHLKIKYMMQKNSSPTH